MPTKKSLAFLSTQGSEDSHRLLQAERYPTTFSPQRSETPSLDTELLANPLDSRCSRPDVPSEMNGVDAGRSPVIHNAFWIAGKVPSLNELLDAKSKKQPILRSIIMRQKPQRSNKFDVYNAIKQDWKQRTIAAVGSPFVRCEKAYFGYVIVEDTLKRDPSNIASAAVKFIEDGLVSAGVIPNDGWNQVLGIRVAPIHRKGREPGVYVVMSDVPLSEVRLVIMYEEDSVARLFEP